MVTKDQAMKAQHCAEFHYGRCTRKIGPKGGVQEKVVRVRVSGACKTFKLEPDEFRLPVKHGLYESYAITNHNGGQFHRAEDCNLLHERGEA